MALDVVPEALDRLLEGDDEPVVLVNLVRLRPGGEAAYSRYQQAVAPLLARYGAELLFAGTGVETLIGDDRWDLALVTRYPNRVALAGLVRDPEFESTTELRHEALQDGLLYAFR